MSAKNDLKSEQVLTIAQKTEKLNELVAWFNSDDFTLELALDKFTEAEKLGHDIESDLLALKNRINIVKEKFESND